MRRNTIYETLASGIFCTLANNRIDVMDVESCYILKFSLIDVTLFLRPPSRWPHLPHSQVSERERDRNVELSVLVAARVLRFPGTRAVCLGRENQGFGNGRNAV